jgi:hypothetical protein
MKVTFTQVCKKRFFCAPTSSSLEQKNENDFEEKTKKSKISLEVVNKEIL